MATDVAEPVVPDCRGDGRSGARSDADYPLRVLYCGVCSLPTEYCEYMPDVTKCRQWLEKNFPDEFAKLTVENSPKQEAGVGEGQGNVGGEEEEKKKQKRGGRGQIKQKKKTVPQKVTIAKIPRAKKKYVTRVCGLATFGLTSYVPYFLHENIIRSLEGSVIPWSKLGIFVLEAGLKKRWDVFLERTPRWKNLFSNRRSCSEVEVFFKHFCMCFSEIDLKEAQRFFAQKFSCGASVTGEDEIIIQGDFTDDIIDVIQEKWPEVDDDSIEDLGEVKK